ncbi:MAG: D-2-hydroxyacid dehydrogenase [Polyangiales bacterium]
MSIKVHVLHPDPTAIADMVRARGREVIEWRELPQRIDAEVIFAMIPPHEGWSSATRLRLLHIMGVGSDTLLPSPDLPENVRIAGARGLYAAEVAEHAITMLLSLRRGLPTIVQRQEKKLWKQYAYDKLEGRTLGLFGRGEAGKRIDAIATAMGMRVIACTRTNGVSLDEVSRQSDALVIAAPHTPATHHAIDARALSLLPAGALVINVARGGIVDETALLHALERGHVGGAALDVFENEPLGPASPWWTAPNTIVSSHLAGVSRRYIEGVVDRMIENVRRLEAGEPLLGEIDRDAGY